MVTYFKQKFTNTLNCVQLQEYECEKCDIHLLTDKRGIAIKCPSCKKAMEAKGQIVVKQTNCQHTLGQNGHQYQ